jgi:hypothetical protein
VQFEGLLLFSIVIRCVTDGIFVSENRLNEGGYEVSIRKVDN